MMSKIIKNKIREIGQNDIQIKIWDKNVLWERNIVYW